eukprot:CAMPEP_0182897758 /NCGR_PEP_ID=MMETSP0034_2-20130328/27087_1 /TAXON_ID=156128 /ORGANISM="Nephroselmis pyriformis, Strain CCMP717" /LENGTH=31 /DNA_ID= /DNA_START= /DNA_END= /DNA_ORIENTATION=
MPMASSMSSEWLSEHSSSLRRPAKPASSFGL